jgi:nucleoside-diphosphate kinase
MERTLVLVKPDAVQRRLVGRVIARLEDKGLRLAGLKMLVVSRDLAAQHYAAHQGKPFYEPLLKFITSGPLVALVVEGPAAVAAVRKLLGATFGAEAEPGTIRGDLALSNRHNLVHGSDSPDAAEQEIARFFTTAELLDYKMTDNHWVSELLPE